MRGARAQIAADHGRRCNPAATEMLTLLAEPPPREPISSDPSPSSRSVAVHRRRVPSWRPAPLIMEGSTMALEDVTVTLKKLRRQVAKGSTPELKRERELYSAQLLEGEIGRAHV